MSSCFISIRSEWATFADGRALRGSKADYSIIDARIDNLDVETLEVCAEDRTGEGLDAYGMHVALPEGLEGDAEDAFYTAAGAAEMRRHLKEAVREIAEDQRNIDLEFDGRRWFVVTGGMSNGDSPNDEYDAIRLLSNAGVCERPLDGETFLDVPVMAATVAVLDELAARAMRALEKANVPAQALEAAKAELEAARCDVGGAAATFRRVMDQVTTERTTLAWRWQGEAFQ